MLLLKYLLYLLISRNVIPLNNSVGDLVQSSLVKCDSPSQTKIFIYVMIYCFMAVV